MVHKLYKNCNRSKTNIKTNQTTLKSILLCVCISNKYKCKSLSIRSISQVQDAGCLLFHFILIIFNGINWFVDINTLHHPVVQKLACNLSKKFNI